MSLFEDSTQYETASRQAKPSRPRAMSVYDDQTLPEQTSPHQGQISLYPSDTVQGSSRRTSHFPRVPDKSFSQQQPPAPHQHAAASAGTSPSRPPPQQLQQRKKQTLDPRPMNLLALDASLYAQPAPVAAPVNNMAAGQIPASASMPQFAAQAQQQQNPLAQASAAVALTALAGKRLLAA